LPRAWLRGCDDFSFSGMNTAVLRLVEQEPGLSASDIAASFQEAVVDVLATKTINAAKRLGARQIVLGGGVTANRMLRQTIVQRSPLPVLIPSLSLCTDNAAMIACCGYFHLQRGDTADWSLDVYPNLRLT